MEVRENIMAGLVRFDSLTSGDVFRVNDAMWLAIVTSEDAIDFNAALLEGGRCTVFEADRMVLPIKGAYVEEGAG